ncbi:MAG: hypothetical protein JXA93_15015, partial [Anaerolineae bacterium]|nr:hypothetical protein [Anaerolineae bacterium]
MIGEPEGTDTQALLSVVRSDCRPFQVVALGSPAQVFTRVSGVALGFRGQFGSNIFRQFVVGIGFKPSAHGEPFGRLVSVPAVLVSQ